MKFIIGKRDVQKKGDEKQMRKENGITLIALIITIIILVILAAVSIRAITNMGIVGHAVNGTQDYARKAKEENALFGNTGNFIEEALAKLRQIQGGEVLEESEELQLSDGELGLAYRVEEQENWDGTTSTYVVITPKIGGVETYEDYAKKILKTTTKTKEQIYMEGELYRAENLGAPEEVLTGLRNATNFTEFVYADMGADGLTTMEQLRQYVNSQGWGNFETVDELLIDIHVVEPSGYTPSEEANQQVHVECIETGENYDVYVGESEGFYIEDNGTYTFTGQVLPNGATVTREVKVTSIVKILVESIALSNTSLSMEIGAKQTLTATINPDNATNQTLEWTSSDEAVASVDNYGNVSALKVGTTTITAAATDGSNATASCNVAVYSVPVELITLSNTSLSMEVGARQTLTATVNPSNATNKNIIWTSSDTSVATVENGIITAQKKGTTTITVSATDGSGVNAECSITVIPAIAFTQNNIKYTWEDVHNIANLISANPNIDRTSGSATVTYGGKSITLNTGDELDLVGVIGTGTSTSNYTYKVRIIGFNTDTLSSTGNSDREYTNGGSKARNNISICKLL